MDTPGKDAGMDRSPSPDRRNSRLAAGVATASSLFAMGVLATLVVQRNAADTGIPETIYMVSHGERFAVPGSIIQRITPVADDKQGVTFTDGRQVPIEKIESTCGTSSNVTSHGSPYLVRFVRPYGREQLFQDVTLPVDAFEVRKAPDDAKTTAWTPAVTDAPPRERRKWIMCYNAIGPKATRRKVEGGELICDDVHGQDMCYAEMKAGKVVAMTEFSVQGRYTAKQAVAYAALFIDSLRPGGGDHAPTTLAVPAKPHVAKIRTPTPLIKKAARPAAVRGNPSEWFPMDFYPPAARREEREGVAGVSVTVGTTGRMTECHVVKTSGHVDLDNATCRLAKVRGRFDPAIDRTGNEVESRIRLPDVTWKLQ